MPDEPVDEEDSGSDAEDASATGSAADAPGAEHSAGDRTGGAGRGEDDPAPAEGADESDGPDASDSDAADADETDDPDADGSADADGDETDGPDGDDPADADAGDPDDAGEGDRPGPADPEWDPMQTEFGNEATASGRGGEGDGEPDATAADVDGSSSVGEAAGGPKRPAAGSPSTAGGAAGDGGVSSSIGGGIVSTPPDDEEMPLTEHIQEMLVRLARVVVVAAVVTVLAFPFADDVIVRMWYDVHPGGIEGCFPSPEGSDCVPPHVYGPLELVLTRIRVAGLAGLVAALPVAVYETYGFMRPGLYPNERRYYLASVPFSLVLAVVGMAFAYLVLLPLLFTYFTTYSEGSAELAFQLADTMSLIIVMMGMLAVVFQIPLFIMLAVMMGVTSRRWLERRRIYFWGLFVGVAFLFGPDPTGMAPFLLTATMVVLFEATLLLLRWTGR